MVLRRGGAGFTLLSTSIPVFRAGPVILSRPVVLPGTLAPTLVAASRGFGASSVSPTFGGGLGYPPRFMRFPDLLPEGLPVPEGDYAGSAVVGGERMGMPDEDGPTDSYEVTTSLTRSTAVLAATPMGRLLRRSFPRLARPVIAPGVHGVISEEGATTVVSLDSEGKDVLAVTPGNRSFTELRISDPIMEKIYRVFNTLATVPFENLGEELNKINPFIQHIVVSAFLGHDYLWHGHKQIFPIDFLKLLPRDRSPGVTTDALSYAPDVEREALQRYARVLVERFPLDKVTTDDRFASYFDAVSGRQTHCTVALDVTVSEYILYRLLHNPSIRTRGHSPQESIKHGLMPMFSRGSPVSVAHHITADPYAPGSNVGVSTTHNPLITWTWAGSQGNQTFINEKVTAALVPRELLALRGVAPEMIKQIVNYPGGASLVLQDHYAGAGKGSITGFETWHMNEVITWMGDPIYSIVCTVNQKTGNFEYNPKYVDPVLITPEIQRYLTQCNILHIVIREYEQVGVEIPDKYIRQLEQLESIVFILITLEKFHQGKLTEAQRDTDIEKNIARAKAAGLELTKEGIFTKESLEQVSGSLFTGGELSELSTTIPKTRQEVINRVRKTFGARPVFGLDLMLHSSRAPDPRFQDNVDVFQLQVAHILKWQEQGWLGINEERRAKIYDIKERIINRLQREQVISQEDINSTDSFYNECFDIVRQYLIIRGEAEEVKDRRGDITVPGVMRLSQGQIPEVVLATRWDEEVKLEPLPLELSTSLATPGSRTRVMTEEQIKVSDARTLLGVQEEGLLDKGNVELIAGARIRDKQAELKSIQGAIPSLADSDEVSRVKGEIQKLEEARDVLLNSADTISRLRSGHGIDPAE